MISSGWIPRNRVRVQQYSCSCNSATEASGLPEGSSYVTLAQAMILSQPRHYSARLNRVTLWVTVFTCISLVTSEDKHFPYVNSADLEHSLWKEQRKGFRFQVPLQTTQNPTWKYVSVLSTAFSGLVTICVFRGCCLASFLSPHHSTQHQLAATSFWPLEPPSPRTFII